MLVLRLGRLSGMVWLAFYNHSVREHLRGKRARNILSEMTFASHCAGNI